VYIVFIETESALTHEEKIEGELAGINHRLAGIESRFAGIESRAAGIENRLMHFQTIGTWLFAGLLASYAAILAVALKH
jgi:hypothetical protein